MELILQNRPAEMQRLRPALEEFARQHQLPPATLSAADLALEEHVTNVMSYAFDNKETHEIRIRLTLENRCLQIEVEDDGRAFDPLAGPPVDTNVPLEEKPVGGLGLHLIRSLMDEVDYRREGGKNILRMRKGKGAEQD